MNEKSKSISFQVPKVLYENRYCNQEGFSILICGGKDKNYIHTNEVLELKIPSLKVNNFPFMVEPHYFLNLATIKSDILAVADRRDLNKRLDKSVITVEIFSEKTKTWTHQCVRKDERICFCISASMSKLYIIGGKVTSCRKSLSLCNSYNPISNTWNKTGDLNVARYCGACTVFEGKIVVTGGFNYQSQFKFDHKNK